MPSGGSWQSLHRITQPLKVLTLAEHHLGSDSGIQAEDVVLAFLYFQLLFLFTSIKTASIDLEATESTHGDREAGKDTW